MHALGVALLVIASALVAVPAAAQWAQPSAAGGAGSAEPTAAQIEAARLALRSERHQLELRVADAWLKHVAEEERSQFRTQAWAAPAFFGLASAAWIAGLVVNEGTGGPRALSFGLGAGAAVSLGLGVATLAASDPHVRNDIVVWGRYGLFAAAGVAVIAAQDQCDGDCPMALSIIGGVTLTYVLVGALLQLVWPPLFVSRHELAYAQRPEASRADYIKGLLLERDARLFKASVGQYVFGVLASLAYLGGAFAAEKEGTRVVFAVLSGLTFLTANATFVSQLLMRTPSDQLSLGLPPRD